jgi:imidazolonepropionase-like amidohydrolase
MVQNPEILVRDGRIVSVRPASATPSAAPSGEAGTRIALPGMTLVPGLIDMHVHLDSDPTYGGYSYLEYNDRIWTPPRLQTIRRQAVRYDCSRISGLVLLHL